MQEVEKTVKRGNFYVVQAEKAHFMRVSGRGVNNLCAKEEGGKFLRSGFISVLE